MRSLSRSIVAVVGFTFAIPVLAFAAAMPDGRVEYERHCIMCHGATGNGHGWLAGFLRQPIPSLTQLKKKNGGVFPVEQVHQVIDGRKPVVLHGPRDMPVWGDVYFTEAKRVLGPSYGPIDDDDFARARIRALIDHISKLQE
jgi:mono/diheme cytochrome c family protein